MRKMALIVFLGLASCGHGQKVCAIIDLVHSTCEFISIRYITPDGQEKTVNVPKDALISLGEAQSQDAGVDGE